MTGESPAPKPKPKPKLWKRLCGAVILLASLTAASLFLTNERDPQWSPSRSDHASWSVARESIFGGWLGQVTSKFLSRNSVISLNVTWVVEVPDSRPPLPGQPRRIRQMPFFGAVRSPNDDPLPIITQYEIDWLGTQTQIHALHLANADLRNLDLTPLANLHRLESLTLGIVGLHDKDLAFLSKLTRLRKLYLYDLNTTANKDTTTQDSMPYMAPLTNIEELLIDGSTATDSALAWISNLDNLRIARLPNLGITGACLDNLRHPEKIIRITLNAGQPSQEFLSNLSRFTNLKIFWIANTTFSDDDLKHLLNLPALQVINLGDTQVTGPGLKTLHAIKTLTKIRVTTAFDEKNFRQLRDFLNKTTAQIEITDGPTPNAYLQGSKLKMGPQPVGVPDAK